MKSEANQSLSHHGPLRRKGAGATCFLAALFIFVGHSDLAGAKGPEFAKSEEGCLIVQPLKGKSEKFGKGCEKRTPPCSTFKIAVAEVGLRLQKIDPQKEKLKWDGIRRDREALNRDQDLKSWMQDSVVWVTSVFVDRIGRKNLQKELQLLNYGNALVGNQEFWIQGPLMISVDEQLKFLSRFRDSDLEKALSLLPVEEKGNWQIHGKTGSCTFDPHGLHQKMGWYVGRARTQKQEFAFALRFLTQPKALSQGPLGFRAKELFLEWVQHQEGKK